MANDVDHRATVQRVVALIVEATRLCDSSGDLLTAAKLEDARYAALAELRRLDVG